MTDKIRTSSRRETPWTKAEIVSPLERFIDSVAGDDYNHRHPSFRDSGETKFLNSRKATHCRHCGSESFVRNGKTAYGLFRYRCRDCGRSFTLLTNTIFDSHKISISEWMGYLLDLFGFGSLTLTSKINRNSINTARYWKEKLFLLLDGIQDDVMLEGEVWLDETFLKVRAGDIRSTSTGKQPRGLSANQLCIGIACDNERSVFFFEGYGKTSGKKTLNAFEDHIVKGSTLIHDKEKAHNKLVEKLGLDDKPYDSKLLNGIADEDNPLCRVNDLCRLLKIFLRSHSGFIREDLQGYLDLFYVIVNPPGNKYEKVRKILELGLEKSVLLRYRDEKP